MTFRHLLETTADVSIAIHQDTDDDTGESLPYFMAWANRELDNDGTYRSRTVATGSGKTADEALTNLAHDLQRTCWMAGLDAVLVKLETGIPVSAASGGDAVMARVTEVA